MAAKRSDKAAVEAEVTVEVQPIEVPEVAVDAPKSQASEPIAEAPKVEDPQPVDDLPQQSAEDYKTTCMEFRQARNMCISEKGMNWWAERTNDLDLHGLGALEKVRSIRKELGY